MKDLTWSVRQLFSSAPCETALLTGLVVIQGLVPGISLLAIQGIIQWIGADSSFPILWVILLGALFLADVVLNPIVSVLRLQLNEKILTRCNILLMEKANTLQGLDCFERGEIYDSIHFLKNEAARRPLNLVYILTGFVKDFIALSSVLFVLGTLLWWLPVALFLANLPHALAMTWFEKQAWDQMLFKSPEYRKMAWLAGATLEEQSAKELRLFGFGNFFVTKYKELAGAVQDKLYRERWQKSTLSIFFSALSAVGCLAIIAIALIDAKNKSLSLGGLVVIIQSLVMTHTQMIGCISYLAMLSPVVLFFSKFRQFLGSSPCKISYNSQREPTFLKEIRFENVSFQYPDGRKALHNLNFSIQKGETIALVGQNGAGKSTLVKLLLRFYDPTSGSITVDGIDLKALDITAWRALISGVFQDFGKYHLTVADNIALADFKATQEKLSDAAFKGGFTPILDHLSAGLQTPLGKEFGGTSLSGGEWQKLAMSRAFLRDAQLLVLDEPTAALDPESEAELFQNFAEVSEGKTTLLITHRLGSVKMTDRILVLMEGELVEHGTHAELLAAHGEYAVLYRCQAEQYLFSD